MVKLLQLYLAVEKMQKPDAIFVIRWSEKLESERWTLGIRIHEVVLVVEEKSGVEQSETDVSEWVLHLTPLTHRVLLCSFSTFRVQLCSLSV